MNKPETLKKMVGLKRWLFILNEEVRELKEMATAIGSPDFGKVNVLSSPTSQDARFCRYVEQAADLERRIAADYARCLHAYADFQRALHGLPFRERTVLVLRYLRDASWSEISEQMGSDAKTVRKLHDHGVSVMDLPDDFLADI